MGDTCLFDMMEDLMYSQIELKLYILTIIIKENLIKALKDAATIIFKYLNALKLHRNYQLYLN